MLALKFGTGLVLAKGLFDSVLDFRVGFVAVACSWAVVAVSGVICRVVGTRD